MGFSVNHEEASSGATLIPEGEYEVVIKAAFEDTTKKGTVYINIPLIVRNDVEQKFQNAYIWHALWKRKEPTAEDRGCGGYSTKQIQTLSKMAGLENGKKYEGLEDWCDDLKHRMIRITVKHEEYNGNVSAKVGYVNESKHQKLKHQFKTTGIIPEGFEEIKGDDLNDEDDGMPF